VVAALDGATILVDVRDDNARRHQGRLPGDLHAPGPTLESMADPVGGGHRPEFTPDRRIVVYCDTGRRSAAAAKRLARLGFTRVAYLEGGLGGWKAQGLEVDQPSADQHRPSDRRNDA
jgi:rhodanese-related sulfurtransferase